MKIYIIIFLIIIIIILWFQKRTDNFTSMESVQNIFKVYTDTSGTLMINNIKSLGNVNSNNLYSNNLSSNKIITTDIDVSNNINVSGNIKFNGNIDISGTMNNMGTNKDYFICTFTGITKLNETYATDLNLLKSTSWHNIYETTTTTREVLYTTRSNDSLNIDWANGKIVGLNPQKIYKVKANIQFNLYNIDTDPTLFVAKLKNGGAFLNESMAFTYQDKVNFTLIPITIIKGSDATLLNISMIRWGGAYNPVTKEVIDEARSTARDTKYKDVIQENNKEVLVTIDITEL